MAKTSKRDLLILGALLGIFTFCCGLPTAFLEVANEKKERAKAQEEEANVAQLKAAAGCEGLSEKKCKWAIWAMQGAKCLPGKWVGGQFDEFGVEIHADGKLDFWLKKEGEFERWDEAGGTWTTEVAYYTDSQEPYVAVRVDGGAFDKNRGGKGLLEFDVEGDYTVECDEILFETISRKELSVRRTKSFD